MIKISLLFVFYFILNANSAFTQVQLQWAQNYNYLNLDKNVGVDLVLDDSDYIYVTGFSSGSISRIDMTVLKYSPPGNNVFTQRFADTAIIFSDNGGNYIVLDSAKNIYTCGTRIWKYSNTGSLLWNYYPGIYQGIFRIFLIRESFILSSSVIGNNFILRKFSINGDSLWYKKYEPFGANGLKWTDAEKDFHDNVVVLAQINKVGFGSDYDYMTVKYSENGDTLWSKRYETGIDNIPFSMVLDDSNYIYVTGTSDNSINLNYNFLTVKYSPSGDAIWIKSFEGGAFDLASDLQVDSSGNVYVVGYSSGNGVALVKYDRDGNFIWVRYQTNIQASSKYPIVRLDKTGDPYIGFSINSITGRYEYGVSKYNKDGVEQWTARYNYNNSYCEIYDMEIDINFDIIATGHCGKYASTVKWSQIITNTNLSYVNVPSKYSLSQNYPNPFNPTTIINYQLSMFSNVGLKIYDVLGQEVKTLVNENKPAGRYEVTFNGADFPSGVYFVRMESGDFMDIKRMVLIK